MKFIFLTDEKIGNYPWPWFAWLVAVLVLAPAKLVFIFSILNLVAKQNVTLQGSITRAWFGKCICCKILPDLKKLLHNSKASHFTVLSLPFICIICLSSLYNTHNTKAEFGLYKLEKRQEIKKSENFGSNSIGQGWKLSRLVGFFSSF